MTRNLPRPVVTTLMLVLTLALAACEATGKASSTKSDNDRSGVSSSYGSPSSNDE